LADKQVSVGKKPTVPGIRY